MASLVIPCDASGSEPVPENGSVFTVRGSTENRNGTGQESDLSIL